MAEMSQRRWSCDVCDKVEIKDDRNTRQPTGWIKIGLCGPGSIPYNCCSLACSKKFLSMCYVASESTQNGGVKEIDYKYEGDPGSKR